MELEDPGLEVLRNLAGNDFVPIDISSLANGILTLVTIICTPAHQETHNLILILIYEGCI